MTDNVLLLKLVGVSKLISSLLGVRVSTLLFDFLLQFSEFSTRPNGYLFLSVVAVNSSFAQHFHDNFVVHELVEAGCDLIRFFEMQGDG